MTIIQLLDETEQNIVMYQWRADQLFADAQERYFFIEADEAFSKCACSIKSAPSYLQLIDICMQLFAGELTNQNREYYEVNDNSIYMQPLKKCLQKGAVLT